MAVMESSDATALAERPQASARDIHLSVIIVTYNCARYIASCIQSIRAAAKDIAYEIIVIDNASTDDSATRVAREFPEARLEILDRNLGFAAGCNAGAALARGSLILLFNPDAEVAPDAIDNLLRMTRERPDAGIWGGATVAADGDPLPGSSWRFPTLWTTFCIVSGLARVFPTSAIFNREAYGEWSRDGELDVEVVSGCLLLIRKVLWDALGGFDETYFLYNEETDLCLRSRYFGTAPVVSPAVQMTHAVGGSQSVRSDRMVRLLTGKRTFMLQHWSGWRQRLGGFLLLCWPFSRFLVLSVFRRRNVETAGGEVWREVWRQRHAWYPGYALKTGALPSRGDQAR